MFSDVTLNGLRVSRCCFEKKLKVESYKVEREEGRSIERQGDGATGRKSERATKRRGDLQINLSTNQQKQHSSGTKIFL